MAVGPTSREPALRSRGLERVSAIAIVVTRQSYAKRGNRRSPATPVAAVLEDSLPFAQFRVVYPPSENARRPFLAARPPRINAFQIFAELLGRFPLT
jgi:hypothetical protein